jgi:hypothetical protein
VEILKDKLEKAQYTLSKTQEEKDCASKEVDKMLEKYDRRVWMN